MKEFVFGNEGEGIRVVVTSEGIEVSAWYDGRFAIKGGFIPWEKLRGVTMNKYKVLKRLGEIETRAEKATPGPWEWVDPETDKPRRPGDFRGSLRTVEHRVASVGALPAWILDADELGTGWSGTKAERDANAEFIAHARTDVPWLCRVVRKLLGEAPEV